MTHAQPAATPLSLAPHPPASSPQPPLVLLVPGLDNSGPDHWQSLWERDDENCRRVELGLWDRPHRNTWVNQLNLAIHRATGNSGRKVVLAAHSLGCLAVAWWAHLEQPEPGHPVIGALLVAPPQVDGQPRDERVAVFAPTPHQPLPFASILVASRDDPWIGFGEAQGLARSWGSDLVDAGAVGHVNAGSDLGHWPAGRRLLARLLAGETSAGATVAPEPPVRAAVRHGLVQGSAPAA